MKRRVYITLPIAALGSAILLTGLPGLAQTAEIPPEKLELIGDNCEAAQSSIQRTQKSDIVSRTNKGRIYEYILRLMAALNSRIALNKLSQPRMVEVTGELQKSFTAFYRDYTDYETQIDYLLNIPCREKPTEFYSGLEQLRALRAKLTLDVQAMNALIEEYEKLVTQLNAELTSEEDR